MKAVWRSVLRSARATSRRRQARRNRDGFRGPRLALVAAIFLSLMVGAVPLAAAAPPDRDRSGVELVDLPEDVPQEAAEENRLTELTTGNIDPEDEFDPQAVAEPAGGQVVEELSDIAPGSSSPSGTSPSRWAPPRTRPPRPPRRWRGRAGGPGLTRGGRRDRDPGSRLLREPSRRGVRRGRGLAGLHGVRGAVRRCLGGSPGPDPPAVLLPRDPRGGCLHRARGRQHRSERHPQGR